jgi:hypothetical protein
VCDYHCNYNRILFSHINITNSYLVFLYTCDYFFIQMGKIKYIYVYRNKFINGVIGFIKKYNRYQRYPKKKII